LGGPKYPRVVVLHGGRFKSPHRKGLASLALLTVWEIWKERNARVFRHKSSPSFVILDKIKCEARLWVLAGAKRLGDFNAGRVIGVIINLLLSCKLLN
jgi:hypothetical protein